MSLAVNLRHLEAHNVSLKGELPVKELDLDLRDELILAKDPLQYELEVEELEQSLLVRGWLHLALDCECARCLKPFHYELELDPWTCHLPLQGEERAPVVNDCVDLTPFIREDILLAFPQHPLCNQDCQGLPKELIGKRKQSSGTSQNPAGSSAWAELNKLKL
jgi:uncharacterized protein